LIFKLSYLSEECSQWQQYQKLLQEHQQCLTVQEVPPAIFWGHELDAIVYDDKPKESKEDQY